MQYKLLKLTQFLTKLSLILLLSSHKSLQKDHIHQDIPHSLREKVETSLLAALIGDSLALGGHHENHARNIKQKIGSYDEFKAHGEGLGQIYGNRIWAAHLHPGKKAGDQTDIGDMVIFLLEYLSERHGTYHFDDFAQFWFNKIQDGYGTCNFYTTTTNVCREGTKPGNVNQGAKLTFRKVKLHPDAKGERRKILAAYTDNLASATHFIPLFLLSQNEELLVQAALSTVYITHKHPANLLAAEFLARTMYRIIHDNKLTEIAMEEAVDHMQNDYITKLYENAQQKVKETQDPNNKLYFEEEIDDMALISMGEEYDFQKNYPLINGKHSHTEGALPGAIYFILKYNDSMKDALIANANIGGESAVRGFIIGMVMGSQGHYEDLPQKWINSLNAKTQIEQWIEKVMSYMHYEN